jgi:hypothetical protein
MDFPTNPRHKCKASFLDHEEATYSDIAVLEVQILDMLDSAKSTSSPKLCLSINDEDTSKSNVDFFAPHQTRRTERKYS